MPSLGQILGALKTAATVAQSLLDVGKDITPIATTIIGIVAKGEDATEEDLRLLQEQSDKWAAEILAADPDSDGTATS